MESFLYNASIVVLANENNPTILNPDFLKIQKIVPEDWEVSDDPITTPPFSSVKYSNGYTIIVENDKVQFAQDGESIDAPSTRLPEISQNYLTVLPHVKYSALGLNFRIAITADDPKGLIVDLFIKDGPWNTPKNRLDVAGLKFIYEENDAKYLYSFDPGRIKPKQSSDAKNVILCTVNVHRDLNTDDPGAIDKLKKLIGLFESDYKRCAQLIEEFFR